MWLALNPSSYLAAIAILATIALTVHLIEKYAPSKDSPAHFASMDGLRGYLAAFVFLHHASIWYFYLDTGIWRVPPSNLFTHFGESSVVLFFMVSGFLYFSKLFAAKVRPIDWRKLYISRLFRLAPLYFFALLLLVLIVAIKTDGQLKQAPLDLLAAIAR